MNIKSIDQFITYVKASFPIIHFLSDEYERVDTEVEEAINIINTEILPNSKTDPWLKDLGIAVGKWNCVHGLTIGKDTAPISGTIDLEDALKYILNEVNIPSVFLMENIHPFLDSPMAPILVQLLIEIYRERYRHKHIVITSTEPLPQALRTYAVTVNFALPTKDDIKEIVQTFVETNLDDMKKVKPGPIANICVGMNALEIESALCVSAVSSKKGLDKKILYDEKAKAVRKSGLLELVEIGDTMDDVGGLDNLKRWFQLVAKAFKNPDKSEQYKLPNMKGVLITGISGTGKSLCAKAIADLFEVPLIRFDIGKVFGSLVGETERNTREAFKLIDAVSPCVVLIDEIEKALSGLESSGSTDSGVTARFIGSFLYYMQEKKSQSFFVCTANDISKLPPEIMRKGRFDELWYVGLPTATDIENILAIHLRKVGRNPSKFNLTKIAAHMTRFTGAEVENCIKEALYNAFFDSREISDKDIIKSAENTVPIVKTRKEEIETLEKWARDRAKMATNGSKNTRAKQVKGKGWITQAK